MTRARKLTLSIKEFSHLVGESLDATHASPSPQPLVKSTLLCQTPPKTRHSSFHRRIFSRSSAVSGQHEDSSERTPENVSQVPRKMTGWPFTRSPRRNRCIDDEHNANDNFASPSSVTSLAAASTSSLGSLIPTHDRLFDVMSRDSDEPGKNSDLFGVVTPSSGVTSLQVEEPPPDTGSSADGNHHVPAELDSETSNATRASFEGTETSHSTPYSEPDISDEDPTPRATTFGPHTISPPAKQRARLQRLSLVSPRNIDILSLRPAIGVAPYVPSANESLTSVYSASSPTSPITQDSFPAMTSSDAGSSPPRASSMPPNPRIPAAFTDGSSCSNSERTPASTVSSQQTKRTISRSLTPPPVSRFPPVGPILATSSSIPPVPPLPPLLNKISKNMSPQSLIPSPPRPTVPGAPMNPIAALPPSSPGALRLPSRLSWVNSVRGILPSPPASPTRATKSLSGKATFPALKPERKRQGELKRPTSIGVIEAADNLQVRRTKSILLLGSSRSKSNGSLGTKRVQIHADVELVDSAENPGTSRKERRKSSATTVSHPVSSVFCPEAPSLSNPEALFRRHSAPLLTALNPNATAASADWTLSLPFFTDVPGNKIQLSPLLTPQLKSEQEEVPIEDWTLCMPLKHRVMGMPGIESLSGRDSSECTQTETSVATETQSGMQLPTPCPSPTWSTSRSAVLPVVPAEDGMPMSDSQDDDRPVTPVSLGPHVGGLDLAGGRGKRASGWHVYGWFDEVCIPQEEKDEESPIAVPEAATAVSSRVTSLDSKLMKSHVAVFRKRNDVVPGGRHPSQDSIMSTSSASETVFYSARSSLLSN